MSRSDAAHDEQRLTIDDARVAVLTPLRGCRRLESTTASKTCAVCFGYGYVTWSPCPDLTDHSGGFSAMKFGLTIRADDGSEGQQADQFGADRPSVPQNDGQLLVVKRTVLLGTGFGANTYRSLPRARPRRPRWGRGVRREPLTVVTWIRSLLTMPTRRCRSEPPCPWSDVLRAASSKAKFGSQAPAAGGKQFTQRKNDVGSSSRRRAAVRKFRESGPYRDTKGSHDTTVPVRNLCRIEIAMHTLCHWQ